MSKTSVKRWVTQLMEWMTTLKSKRSKQVKSSDTRQSGNAGYKSTSSISSNIVRIKNGPSGRR